MKHTIEHDLGSVERARAIVEKAYAEYQQKLAKHHPVLEWVDDRTARIGFTVMSKSMAVHASVTETTVTLDGKMPLLFKPFEGRVVAVLDREVKKWIERERAAVQ